ncbi:MAG: NYN domain-containing protein [Myxococcota bacterium]
MTQAGRSPLDPWIEDELATSGRRALLVDGFNVLHTVLLAGARDGAWWGRAARERLLDRLAGWPEAGDAIWVAFDGNQPAWSVLAVPAPGPCPGARARGPIVHSLFVESADDWIVRRARRAACPDRTVVVSADRKVAGRARSAGCLVWSPWEFVAQIPVGPEIPGVAGISEPAWSGGRPALSGG